MSKARFAKAVAAIGVAVLCMGALGACASSSNSGAASGPAATVNGVEIPESTVTANIESVRANAGLDDPDKWGAWLVANNYTPTMIREEIIDGLVERELLKAGAKDKDVTVSSEEIDGYVDAMKNRYPSAEAWASALQQAGYTEETYRAQIESSLLQQDMLTKFEDEAEVTNEALLESANTYASYYKGGKRSSHILFAADEAATAQQVLDQINAGTLDFAEAAAQYSNDTSAQNGGDVGWDVSSSFVTEYQDALDALGKGQVSGLVTSQFGIHIIKCTDVFDIEGEITDINQVPEDLRETITERAKYLAGVNAFQDWMKEQKDNATIDIKEIPANVPYNIDLTKYQEAADKAAAEAAAQAEATASDAAASADAASADAASSDASASSEAASADAASASSSSAAQ